MSESMVERLVVGVGYKFDPGFKAALGEMKGALGQIQGLGLSVSKGLEGIGRGAGAAGAEIVSVMGSASTAALGLGQALGVVTLAGVGFAVSQAQAATTTALLARDLGVTTESLTALEYAAAKTRVPVESVHGALQQLTAASRAAALGSDGQILAFGRLGVKTRDATGALKSASELLPEVADKLSKMGNTARAAEIRTTLLGDSTGKLKPLLALGSAGLADMARRGEQLGVVLSEESAAGALKLTGALQDIRLGVSGLVRPLGDLLIPYVGRLAEGFADLLADGGGFVRIGMDRSVTALGWALKGLDGPAGKAALSLTAIASVIGVGKAAVGASSLISGLGPLGAAFGGLTSTLTAFAIPLGIVAAALGLVALGIDEIIITAEGGDSVIRRMADALGIGDLTVRAFGAGVTIVTETIRILGETVTATFNGLMGDVAMLAEAGAGFSNWLAGIVELVPGLQSVADALRDIGGTLEAVYRVTGGAVTSGLEGVAGFLQGQQGGDLSAIPRESGAYIGRNMDRQLAGAASTAGMVAEWSGVSGAVAQAGQLGRQAVGGALTIAPSISVTAGQSREDIARAAASAVEKGVLAQLETTGGW